MLNYEVMQAYENRRIQFYLLTQLLNIRILKQFMKIVLVVTKSSNFIKITSANKNGMIKKLR